MVTKEDILAYMLIDLLATVLYFVSLFKSKKNMLPSDSFHIYGLLIAGGLALAQGIIGGIQKAKAAKMARANRRPVLPENPYTDKMYGLTGAMAQQGLSDAAKAAYASSASQATSSGIDAILKGGGSMNNIGDLIEGGNAGYRALALADEEAKNRNIQNFLQMGLQQKANENRDQFFLNQYVPFKDNAELIAKLSQQGSDNIWKGVNGLGSAALGYMGSRPIKDSTELATPRLSAPTASTVSTDATGRNYTTRSVADTLAPTTMSASKLFDNNPKQLTVDNILTRHFNSPGN